MPSSKDARISVLFVCMGNICRSPTAEGVFRQLVRQAGHENSIEIDSAGTHAYHVGSPPDERSQDYAWRRGYDLSGIRARIVEPEDFVRFELVLAMDSANLENLEALCPPGRRDRLKLFLDYAESAGTRDVPDPYYGGGGGFDTVLDLVEDAAKGLLASIVRDLNSRK